MREQEVRERERERERFSRLILTIIFFSFSHGTPSPPPFPWKKGKNSRNNAIGLRCWEREIFSALTRVIFLGGVVIPAMHTHTTQHTDWHKINLAGE